MLKKLGVLFLVATMLFGCTPKRARQDKPEQVQQPAQSEQVPQVQPEQPQQEAAKSVQQAAPQPQQATPAQSQPVVGDSLVKRQMQSRIFDTSDEQMVLTASIKALKDLGFTVEENHPALGLITCSKSNEGKVAAVKVGTVVLGIAVSLLTRGYGLGAAFINPLLETGKASYNGQKFRASLVSAPIGEKGDRIMVRLIVQSVAWNSDTKELIAAETIADPKIYQAFFDKLSQSISLEAHSL